jgi:hypothetical protein
MSHSRRRFKECCLVITVVLMFVMAPVSGDLVAFGQRPRPSLKPPLLTRFFNNASHDCYCGYKWRKCTGEVVLVGCQTQFSTDEEISCSFIPEQPLLCEPFPQSGSGNE